MANPPITIGPFANVPAPGSPIRSDWAQQITNHVWGNRLVGNCFGAVYDNGQLRIQTGTVVLTTDASGITLFTYPIAFARGGIGFAVHPGDLAIGLIHPLPDYNNLANSGAFVQMRLYNSVGGVLANATIRLVYTAIGPRI